MDTNIEKVNRRTVADQVFHIILKKISSGEWKIGEKIPSEIELAQDLGVSRTTLKMALQKLNTLGILETRVGEGSFVCEFSFNSLFSELLRCNLLTGNNSELNQFRVLVEYCVLRLAVLNPITEDEIDALEVHLNEMKRAIETGDEDGFHYTHFAFHYSICQMSKNKLFIQLYESFKDTFFDIYKANSRTTWQVCGTQETLNHHQKLFDSIKAKDVQQMSELQEELLTDEYLNAKQNIDTL